MFRSPFKMKPSSLSEIQNILSMENIAEKCFRVGPASSKTPTIYNNTCIDFTIVRYDANADRPRRWDPDIRTICQFTECLTTDNRICKFPFKYKGRLYDTCITIDSAFPWCSLSVDEKRNHIDHVSNQGRCQESCFVQNCPVGFFSHEDTCIHLSARTYSDVTNNIDDAEAQCVSKGARLYQPRDYTSFESLKSMENEFLKAGSPLFYYYSTKSFTILGAYTERVYPGLQILYMDGTRAYMIEKKIFLQGPLKSSTISNVNKFTGKACVMMDDSGFLSLERCSTSFYLAYICEAKTILTVKGPEKNTSCHFPFKIESSDNMISSCIINKNTGDPWCATKVDENGVMIPEKWGTCIDERKITYRGSGDGNNCDFPFLYDRVWYEKCMYGNKDEIWCPTKLNPTREFNETIDEFAYCTEFMGSSGGECSPNYDKVNGLCLRVSPLPETFTDSASKCEKEGASLLTIDSYTPIRQIKEYIQLLSVTKTFFEKEYAPDLSSYWVGGIVKDFKWRWMSNSKNFTSYSNWKNGKENSGCSASICTDNYGLTIESGTFNWVAEDKAKLKPYICESNCKFGYKWHSNVKKCLRVTGLAGAVSYTTAILECAQDKARLIHFSTCDDFIALSKDLWKLNQSPLDEYWVGFLGGGLDEYRARRVSADQRLGNKTISSNGYAGVLGCSWFTSVDLGAQPSKAFLRSMSADEITVRMDFVPVKETGDLSLKGFICEVEKSWTCPDNYIMFQEECYLLINNPQSFTEALVHCNSNGSSLFEPMTEFHIQFITEYLKQEMIGSSTVWTGYRKELYEMTLDQNKFYHTSDYVESFRKFPGISGGIFKYFKSF